MAVRPKVSNQGRGAARPNLGLCRQWHAGRIAPLHIPEERLVAWAQSFVFAGASALLLLGADFFPKCWVLSFIALTPFLYRIAQADRLEALRLGCLLGLTFFGVRIADAILVAPVQAIAVLLGSTGLLVLSAWTLCRAKEAWGFNPLVVALIWVICELGLIRLGSIRGLFPAAEFGVGLLYKTAVLFGFLTVSFVIVLINSILIAAVNAVVSLARARGVVVLEGEGNWDLLSTPGLVAQRLLLVAEGRAPPGELLQDPSVYEEIEPRGRQSICRAHRG